MATQALYQQLLQALEHSRNFKFLPPDEQLEMKQQFAGATDEQIMLAIQTVQKDNAESIQREEQAVKELKATMKGIEKKEIEDNKSLDAAESEKAAEEALSGLGQVKQEKKKILGIL